MKNIVNQITTIMGVLIIPYACWLVHSIETFGAWDWLLMVFGALFLIWFKDNAARDFMNKLLNKQISNKE